MHWFSTSTFLLSQPLQRALAWTLEGKKRGIKRGSYADKNKCLKAVEKIKEKEQSKKIKEERAQRKNNIKLNLEFKQ